MNIKTKVAPFTVTIITIGSLAGGVMAQNVTGTYDFADGTTSLFSDTSQVGDAVWGSTSKAGQLAPAIATLGNLEGGADIAGSRAWSPSGQFLGDGATGSASFDFMSDFDGAITQGDRIGLSYLGATSSLFIGYQAGASTWDLVVDNGTTTNLVASVGPADWTQTVWFDLSFDYTINGGSLNLNHEINGFYEEETLNLPHPTLGSIATITGSSSHSVSGSLGADTAIQFGLTAEVAAITSTANNRLDNLSFNVNSVPEPSSSVLFGLGLSSVLFQRRRKK